MSLQRDFHTLQTSQTLPTKDFQTLQILMEVLAMVNEDFLS